MRIRCLYKEEWLLALVCCFSFFVNNHSLFPDIMESRNLVTAYEMAYDGNWLLPTMNGEWRLEKPPLPTWIAALVEIVFPDRIGMQRGMAGLFAVLLVIFSYKLARLIGGDRRFAFLSAIILCTCYSVALMGRTVSWDIYCHAFMMGAVYYLVKMFRQDTALWKNACLAGMCMGLSFMSKGPISFYALLLPFGLAYGYIFGFRLEGKIKAFLLVVGIGIFIAAWWYVYLYVYQENVLKAVIGKETSSWIYYNIRPWYYYWNFFLEAGVWSLLLITSLLLPIWSKADLRRKEYLFFLIWLAGTILLLSSFPEKKKRYLFPAMIPASYLMGYLLFAWENRLRLPEALKMDRLFFRTNTMVLAMVAMALPFVAYYLMYSPGHMSSLSLLVLSVMALLFLFCFLLAAQRLRVSFLLLGGVALFEVAAVFFPSISHLVNYSERRSIAELRQVEVLRDLPFYHNKKDRLRIELVYAARKKIRPLDVSCVDSVRHRLPCVLLTHGRVGEELPAALWEQADSTYLGCYDDNSWPPGSRRYSKSFIYHVTLLREK